MSVISRIMKINLFGIIGILLFSVTVSWGQGLETQVGPFNFAGSLMKETKLIALYGDGYIQTYIVNGKVLDKKHIYYVSDAKVWVEISVSHVLDEHLARFVEAVLVTKKKLCDTKFEPKRPFGPLVTGKGVNIGDSLNKIIKTYGSPSISILVGKDKLSAVLIDDLRLLNGRVLRYLTSSQDELLFSEFYFLDNKLHSILISISE